MVESLQMLKRLKNADMHVYVDACVTHDDLITNKADCCINKKKKCGCRCTRVCTVVRFCEVTWSGEWVVNFSHLLPVWLSWSSMEHRARCFSLSVHNLKIKLDRMRSRKAGEFAAVCMSHLRVRLPTIVRRQIMRNLHQLLIVSAWPTDRVQTV